MRNELFTDRCYYCERPYGFSPHGSNNPLLRTKDHIIPKSKGGSSKKENIVYCCNKCNILKGQMIPDEFIGFLNNQLLKERPKHGRQYIFLVLVNVVKLRDKIAPYYESLMRPGWRENFTVWTDNQVENVRMSVVPRNYQKLRGGTHSDKEIDFHKK